MARPGESAGHVFISYVREDSQNIDELQRKLESAAIPVWRDTADLWPGEDWRAKIRSAITDNALVFIACFSRASSRRAKSYQNEELLLAIEQLRRRRPDTLWLIPVRFDDTQIPDLDIGGGRTLASIQRADLFGDHAREGSTRLIGVVLRILGQSPQVAVDTSIGLTGRREISETHAYPDPVDRKDTNPIDTDPYGGSGASPPSRELVQSIVSAMMQVRAMSEHDSRNLVASLLPEQIQAEIPYNPVPRQHIINIVMTCLNYPNGRNDLLEILYLLEGKNFPSQGLRDVLSQLTGPGSLTGDARNRKPLSPASNLAESEPF